MLIICLARYYRPIITAGFWQNDNKFCVIVFGLIWVPMLISLFDAINLKHSLQSTLSVLPMIFVGIYLIDALENRNERQKLVMAIIMITTLWCLDALYQLFHGTNILGYPKWAQTHLSGIFSPKTTLGIVVAVVLPVVLEGLRSIARGWRTTIVTSLIAAIHIAVIILSGSRTALLMMVLGGTGWLMYVISLTRNISWRKLIMVCAIVIVATGYLSSRQSNSYLTQLTDIMGADLKTIDRVSSGRIPLWETAGRIYLDHWVNGVGPRGFRHIYNEYKPIAGKYNQEYLYGSTHPHFVLLEIASETGSIGLLCIFVAVYFLFTRLKILSTTGKLNTFPWMYGAAIAIIPNVGKAFYSFFWMSLVLWMIFIGIANSRTENSTTAMSAS
jgi:O-antigen ligase